MWHRKFTLVALAFGVIAPSHLHAKGACDAGQRSAFPDVRLISASEESLLVPERVSYARLQCAESVYPDTGNAPHH